MTYQAAMLGLPTHIVSDAGKTQIARGSRTVLAIAGKQSIRTRCTLVVCTLTWL
jgi:peptidyl-tRNA hydrolase